MTITEFLLARIEEDEAVALASDDGPWFAVRYYVGSGEDQADPNAEIARAGSKADAAHIARHDPTRVLAECAAKRAIIAEVTAWGHRYIDEDMWYSCGLAVSTWDHEDNEPGSGCLDESKRGRCTCALEARQLLILKPLAGVYSTHPEWRNW